ncbi:MAG TPA: FkbM family methyltransferase [Steroidobacteraceae bacterium]|nr:FkbM family methyltransferase [Steroidobacteraceae bacterium]
MPTLRQKLLSTLTRRYPFYSGCAALANHPWIDRLAGSSSEKTWARVCGGEVLASLDDFVGRAAFYVGDLDRKLSWIYRRLIRPGDTVLDIGANIGIVTVGMAKLVGSAGRVHAFEPNPRLTQRLHQVIDRNHLSQVTIHALALGAEAAMLDLHIPRDNAGAGSLIRKRGRPCEIVTVRVERLSAILEPQPIRLIKIDVEGFEAEVFRGAEALLRAQPAAILFELNGDEDRSGEAPLLQLLAAYGYAFLAIPKSLLRMRLVPIDHLSADELTGHDFLAVARSHYDEVCARLRVRSARGSMKELQQVSGPMLRGEKQMTRSRAPHR